MHRIVVVFSTCLLLSVIGLQPSYAADVLTPCDVEPTDMMMAVGEIVSCAIDPVADSDLFRFDATIGEVILLTLADRTITGFSPQAEAQVFDPSQLLIATIGVNDGSEVLQLDVTVSGTYTVLVTEAGSNSTVAYHVALQRLFPAPPDAQNICYGAIVEDEPIDPISDSDVFLFSGNTGDTIILTLTDRTVTGFSPRPEAQVFDPDQQLIATLGVNDGSDSLQLDVVVSGLYTVYVTEAGSNSLVAYNLALQCLFGVCPNVLIFSDDFESGNTTAWSATDP